MSQYKGRFSDFTRYFALGRNALVDLTGMIIAYVFFINGWEPFRLTGAITSGLPSFKPPPFSTQLGNQTLAFGDMVSELGAAPLIISFISILEAVTVATIFVGKTIPDENNNSLALFLRCTHRD